ncbi:hypothetical protein CSC2_49390 [Clostridium zeae]|uniref:YfjL-like N-terminal domain-containing protein n=1 Tax=Clostridium zeae TaxID=2759022 RepID=A0ABQ1EIP7_9CLOT|nr:hypothetical protein [Clostridium zeae]GFZ34413.1 hypothetical protein CSC2_49390 [Clostridium zeae]
MENKRFTCIALLVILLVVVLLYGGYFDVKGNAFDKRKVSSVVQNYLSSNYKNEEFKLDKIEYSYDKYVVNVQSSTNRFKEFNITVDDEFGDRILKDEYKENSKQIELAAKVSSYINNEIEPNIKESIPQFSRIDIEMLEKGNSYDSVDALLQEVQNGENDVLGKINIILKGKNITEKSFLSMILSLKGNEVLNKYSKNFIIAFYYYPKYANVELQASNILSYPYYSVELLENSSLWNYNDLEDKAVNWKINFRYVPELVGVLFILISIVLVKKLEHYNNI